jgi:hypothetical protein
VSYSANVRILDQISVASPCLARWEDMKGDERRRFCEQCQLHVYNLSGMTSADAERVVSTAEGRLCVSFFRRSDGTILTEDCPIGLRARARRQLRRAAALVAGILGVGVVDGCAIHRERTAGRVCLTGDGTAAVGSK